MTKARLLMLFALCAVCPATAHAQSGILDWLQGGSGPGPYKSLFTGYEIRVWCLPTGAGVTDTAKRQAWNCLLDDPDRTKGVLSFGASYASSSDTGRLFLDDPADVREVKERVYTVAYTHRFNKLINVGGTVDFINFKSDQGNAFSFWRFGIGPRLVFTPFGNLTTTDPRMSSLNRAIHLQVDTTWLTQGLKASDFNNAVSRYDPGAEFQVRATVAIDFAFVLRAIHPQ